jgi:2-polyprenyl-3-methyl-5-hydroxy-6-metoxy-1,4-benzoquinol methylase
LTTTGSSDTYARNAEFWVRIIRERLDRYRSELTDAEVLAAIGDAAGQRILDGGCGEGYLSRALADRGASVTGLDLSESLIAAARAEATRSGRAIEHYVASLDAIPEQDGTFDTVVCNHVLSDVSDPDSALKEIGRVTRLGGRLVALMLHPCFYVAHAERDASGSIPVSTYFSTRTVNQPFKVAGITSPEEVHMNFRPLEHYMSAIINAGYVITNLSEPHPSAELLRDDEWWRTNFVKPLFLLVLAERR